MKLRREGWIAAPISIVLMAFAIAGCGGPEREIRKTLNASELALFDRGQRLSTPCWSCHDLYGEQNKVGPFLSAHRLLPFA